MCCEYSVDVCLVLYPQHCAVEAAAVLVMDFVISIDSCVCVFAYRLRARTRVCRCVWMDGWLDRWLDGWMDGQMDVSMYVWMYGWMDGQMDR